MTDVDFAEPGVEDAYGSAHVAWDVSGISDGDYELMARTVCDHVDGAEPEFNWIPSAIIMGTIERKPPRLFGLPQPSHGELFVGDAVSFTFQEPVECRQPFRFDLTVNVEGLEPLSKDNLLVVCEDRTISFLFDPTKTRLDRVVDNEVQMSLADVKDLSQNALEDPVEHALAFADFTLQVEVEDCVTMMLNVTEPRASCRSASTPCSCSLTTRACG